MMGATASELKLPPAQVSDLDPPLPPAKAPEEEIPKGRLREVLVPAHEMVPAATPPAPAATEPTGEQIDAALRAMVAVPAGAHDDAVEPTDANDKANLAALMAREAKLAKYAALKEKAAATIGRGLAAPKAPKGAEGAEATGKAEGAEGAEGEAAAGDAIVEEAGPPPVPLVERLTTGKNLIYSEIVVALAIVVAFFFIWHAVSGLFIHPSDWPEAAAPARKAPSKKPLPDGRANACRSDCESAGCEADRSRQSIGCQGRSTACRAQPLGSGNRGGNGAARGRAGASERRTKS